ncbi:diguanylate cyclase [Actinoplanes sp. SE50]|uniref:putative bifunctional diguanylate cyclase/phosphodiesterase n=1 Tax=unclassified Actinoplanes TaxID=2626549 RepID=UPI00023ECC80|nr:MULTISPECIES: bifunctional diguanylate cyclase/phosphodiesterase [unclassified Actinoplanes]AEV83764.1 putative signaling protein [Actinoplanes sp. SE50/110]ATO82092.1 diguanylate cyclase [Actinoplanes sp. SE50]SLL99499.1 diguanylate cyclase [Actinoplanes sp. SE50/110]
MSTRGTAAEQRRRGGLAPAAVALTASVAVVLWLALGAGNLYAGFTGGPIAMAAAAFACQRIAATVRLPPPVRSFWRQLQYAAFCLLAASVVTLFRSNNDTGLSPYVGLPMLVGILILMTAFLRLPFGTRTATGLVRALLDGATVAVASGLIFWYVVLDLAPAGTSLVARIVAAVIGVCGVLLLVVIGKAAAAPSSPVDPASLRVLTVAPVVAVTGTILLIAGSDRGRLILSVLAVPSVAVAMAVAAYLQRRARRTTTATAGRSLLSLLPFLAVTATAALVISVSAQQMSSRQRTVIIGAVLIAGFVVARQLLSLRENTIAMRGIRRQQAELERLALSDTLTGLPNRTRFAVALGDLIGEHRPASALLIDVDDFKMINDTLGPAAGDQLLFQVAERLRRHCLPGELPARLGGDEFAVLLPVDDPAEAEAAAARLLAGITEPFKVGDQQLLLHASVGIAIAATGETADEVQRNADIAMYAAKEAGKASWVRFEPRMRHDMVHHARLASELHNGIIRGELRLVYQPVFDLVTGRVAGAEALVRWQHPTRGFVSPADFIPVAERSGLIVPLGAWVLREACAQLARWRAQYGDDAIESINVNVAVRQLRETGFVDEVAAVLSEAGLTSRNLILEVTESSVVDGWQVRETLQALHEMGVMLALDDFGTGQSSLSLLRAFPVDVLKLDKSFVDGIADGADRGRLAVAAAVAQLAEYLQLKAVAEGIESAEQRDRLRDMGYRYGQGYHMAKPLPAEECGALMSAAPVPAAVRSA